MIGKNILYIPQLSMYDKKTKKFIPAADGNINMMRNTILEWKKYRKDDMFFILLPKELQFSLNKILPSGTLNAAPIFYDSYVVSARINRYNFPMTEFISILKDFHIDLLINDVIEITPNFRQMFKIEFNYQPKIISNIRHVDEGNKSDYIFSVIDGMVKSDLVTILSKDMRKKLSTQANIGGVDRRFKDSLIDKLIIFEPSVSYDEIEQYKSNAVVKDLNNKIITFPGRLSFGEEERTNWDKFIEAIQMLREERQDFIVYLTDPNNAITLEENATWIKTIEKDRRLFLNLLNHTDIIVSLMDVEGFGGISIREALLFNCRPIIPNVHEYKNMMEEDYYGFVHSPINVKELVDRLDWALDKGHKSNYSIYEINGMKYTIEEQFKNLLPKIEELL